MDVTSGPDPSSMTNDLVSDLLSLKPFLEAHHCRTDAIDRAIAAIEQHTGLVAENALAREAAFLCARLRDFAHDVDASDTEDIYREFHGHVAPSLARLEELSRAALAHPQGEDK